MSVVTPSAAACAFCGEPRPDSTGRYCDICRYDFVAQAPGPPPRSPLPPQWLPTPVPGVLEGQPTVQQLLWEAVVIVDPSLDIDPDPDAPCPKDRPPGVFPLNLPEVRVGRHDARHDVQPDIALQDPGVSHRHAVLRRTSDGGVEVLDEHSTNGTDVNGVTLAPDTSRRLHDGDAVTLGRWTRITIRRGQ